MAATQVNVPSSEPEASTHTSTEVDKQQPDNRYAQVVCAPRTAVQTMLCVLHWVLVLVAIAVVLLWLVPKYLGTAVADLAIKARLTMTDVQIGVICTIAIWILTMIFIPSQPFAWLAAIVFKSFGIGFLIIEIGTTLGFVCAFVLGRTVLSKRAMRLFHKYKGSEAVLQAVDRLGAFKVIVLLRFGPLPYSFVSYVSSVPDNVPFSSYFLASFLALAPRNAATIWLGTSFVSMTDLFAGKPVNTWSIIFNIVALVVTCVVVIGGSIYCRNIMKRIEEDKYCTQSDLEAAVMSDELHAKDDSAPALSVQAQAGKSAVTTVQYDSRLTKDQQS